MIKHICFIVPNYPYEGEPTYTFVREVIAAIADLGIVCTVIASQSLTNKFIRGSIKRPFLWKDKTEKENTIFVYQPTCLTFSDIKICGRSLSAYSSKWAIKKTYNKINIKPDLIYAHFWHCGVTAGSLVLNKTVPLFVASGESKIWVRDLFSVSTIDKNLKPLQGVISVSSKNKMESIDLKLATEEDVIVIPNAVDPDKFYSMDRGEARRKLGYSQEDFIVAYTGAFSERKGVLRLAEAVGMLENVKSIYIGSGDLEPQNKGILFRGRLSHEEVALYLNASDVFVLPTLAEGCSNAIVEAMACGLPIISSDRSFNDDILDKNNSIKIDPNNIEEIASSINYLKNNPEHRKQMSEASLRTVQELTIENRARVILDFIKRKM